ncbi:site-specific integrase [Pyruvatibacter sp. HU-CL02332]
MATIRQRNNRWQVQVRRQNSPTLSKTFSTLKDARAWARAAETRLDRGELETLRPSSHSLGHLLEIYRDRVTPARKGAGPESYVLGKLMRSDLAKLQLSALRPEPFALYRDERLKEVSAATLCRELWLIQHAIRIARQEWGWVIPENPIEGIRKPTIRNARTRRLTGDEEGRLLDACAQARNEWLLPLVKLAIATAMRRGELLKIAVSDIGPDHTMVLLRDTKNGHDRHVPLSPVAREIIQSRVEKHEGALFPVSANAVKLSWRRATKRSGIEDLRFHDLRHEAISRFAEMGLSIPEIAAISGHRDPRMLFRYTHLELARIIEKLG